MLPDFLDDLGHGIYAIDTGFQRPRFDAAYLVVENGHAAFIDTGTNHAAPRQLAALDALGLSRDAVDWVIPTHVHLDHAGGVGLIMEALPRARAGASARPAPSDRPQGPVAERAGRLWRGGNAAQLWQAGAGAGGACAGLA